jgi:hypothetical protein
LIVTIVLREPPNTDGARHHKKREINLQKYPIFPTNFGVEAMLFRGRLEAP